MTGLLNLTVDEGKHLIRIAHKLRRLLQVWKSKKGISRSDGLSACAVLVGSEGGLEGAHSRDDFLAFMTELMGWAYDIGAQTRADLEKEARERREAQS